jgi:tRNA(fMet)-specific endonuclease VapC
VSLFILDTDHITLLRQRHPLVSQRVALTAPNNIAVTIVTFEEQVRGWLSAIRRYNATPRQQWAYQGLHGVLDFFCPLNILDFDQAAHTQFEDLRRQKIRIGTQDLRIAAIVLIARGTLVTRNQRDFAQVSGLALADWSIP